MNYVFCTNLEIKFKRSMFPAAILMKHFYSSEVAYDYSYNNLARLSLQVYVLCLLWFYEIIHYKLECF